MAESQENDGVPLHTDAQPNSKTYRLLLKNVSDQMTKRDIAAMKFLCSDHIASSKLEKIRSTIAVIQELENMNLLCQQNCSFLSELLFRVGRRDLIRKIGINPVIVEDRLQSANYQSPLSAFRILLHKIGMEIPQKQLENIKFLFQDHLSASSMEGASDIWRLFGLMEMSEVITPEDPCSLTEVAQVIGREDLSEAINNFRETCSSPVDMKPPVQSYLAREVLRTSQEESLSNHQASYNVQEVSSPGLISHGGPVEPQPIPEVPISSPIQASDDHGGAVYPNIVWPPSESSLPSLNNGGMGYNSNQQGNPHGNSNFQAASVNASVTEGNISGVTPGDQQAETLLSHLVLDTVNIQGSGQIDPAMANQMPSPEAGMKTPPGPVPGNRMYLGPSMAPTNPANRLPQYAGNYDDTQRSLMPSYKMTSIPRGICIIINNANFTKNPKNGKILNSRPGSQKDQERLTHIFTKLGFDVKPYQDKTADQLHRILKVASLMSFSGSDAIVICILSHGAYGAVYGSDGQKVQIGDILHYFKADVCPTLAGKPKLFFIQACQGNQKTKASKIQPDDDHIQTPKQELVAPDADFLIGYATVPGCVSYRHEDQGSWYINTLVNQLDKYCHREDLLSIMTAVTGGVADHDAPEGMDIYKQVPLPYSTLTKKVYLRPM